MKKFALGLLTGIVFATGLLAFAAETFTKGDLVFLLSDQESIRFDAKVDGEVMSVIKKGTPLVVIENQGEWIKVALSGFVPKTALTDDYRRLKGKPFKAQMIVCADQVSADKLLAQIKAGADFGKVAKENSIDKASASRNGDLGEFYPGDFSPTIENAIKALKVGGVSTVIKVGNNYHIFKRLQ